MARLFLAALWLAVVLAVPAQAQQRRAPGYSAPTLGSTSIPSGATVTALTGFSSLGITAPAANSAALTVSGASHTGADATSDVAITSALSTSGSPSLVSIAATGTFGASTSLLTLTAPGVGLSFDANGGGTANLGGYYAVTNSLTNFAANQRVSQLDSTGVSINASGVGVRWFSGAGVLSGSVDTGLSRDSAGVVDVGTGAQGSKAGSMNMTNMTATGTVTGVGGSLTALTALAIRDTSAAFDVTLAGTSSTALSAGRTLTLDMKNVAHTLAFNATANTITFPNTASYTLIGSGDVNTVTLGMLAQGATNTVLVNATSGTANFTAQNVGTCSTAGSALIWTTNTGFGCNTSITAATNANLTGPITSVGNATSIGAGPAPVACTGTCTLGASNRGTYTRLDTAGGSVATLPGATGSGSTYKLYVSVATTSNSHKVLTNPTSDTIIGTAIGENAGTAKVFVGNALTAHSIQMPFTGSQPSGGFIGDTIVCTDVASTIWKCDINYQGGTTPTTPYSTATS